MRLLTWNCCRGPAARKLPLIEALRPDIAVIQECPKPAEESDQCVWVGDSPRQGLAVLARGAYRLRRLQVSADVPRYVVPIDVSGPEAFLLLAVWTMARQPYRYIEAACRAVDLLLPSMAARPTVLAGDFNSNPIWDKTHPADLNHSALLQRFRRLGIRSAYHQFHGEEPGQETQATFYFQWKKMRPYHIDYIFFPDAWASRLRLVQVGSFEDWESVSDHRPLLAEFSPQAA